jgi:tripartite-type tricarboxylate transporter receptor subunit TctC
MNRSKLTHHPLLQRPRTPGRRGMLKTMICAAAGLLVAGASPGAAAQNYPEKPITIIVPFPPGASLDSMVRIVAQKLGESWNQRVIVENRTGASGIIGVNAGAKAAPDGYTLVAVSNSFAANTVLRNDMPYDAFKDFAPVTLLGSVPHVLVAHSSVPVQSVKELVAYAKQHPGRLNYASGGSGTISHLGGEMFKRAAGIDLVHVPYRGQGPALADVVSGQVSLTLGNMPEVMPHVKSGRVKALAVVKPTRSKLDPQIPTLAEAGYPGVISESWYGLVAPANTAPAIVAKLQREIARVLAMPDVSERLAGQGFEPSGNTPEAFKNFLQTQTAIYRKIIDEATIKSD